MEEQISISPRCEHGGLLMRLPVTPDVESRSSTTLVQLWPWIWEPVSKMEESTKAHIPASLKTAQDPDGAVPSVS